MFFVILCLVLCRLDAASVCANPSLKLTKSDTFDDFSVYFDEYEATDDEDSVFDGKAMEFAGQNRCGSSFLDQGSESSESDVLSTRSSFSDSFINYRYGGVHEERSEMENDKNSPPNLPFLGFSQEPVVNLNGPAAEEEDFRHGIFYEEPEVDPIAEIPPRIIKEQRARYCSSPQARSKLSANSMTFLLNSLNVPIYLVASFHASLNSKKFLKAPNSVESEDQYGLDNGVGSFFLPEDLLS